MLPRKFILLPITYSYKTGKMAQVSFLRPETRTGAKDLCR